jgi:hypothetical protein
VDPYRPHHVREPPHRPAPRRDGACFSAIGLIATAVPSGLARDQLRYHDDLDGAPQLAAWLATWDFLSLGVFAVHVVGGFLSLGRGPSGRSVFTAYGVAALVLFDVFAMQRWAHACCMHEIGTAHLAYSMVAVLWPTTVAILVHTRKVRGRAGDPLS